MNQTNQVLRPAVRHIVARPPDLFLNLNFLTRKMGIRIAPTSRTVSRINARIYLNHAVQGSLNVHFK